MKKFKFDKIKILKKISREENKQYGKAGPHKNKKEKYKNKYIDEYLIYEVEEENQE